MYNEYIVDMDRSVKSCLDPPFGARGAFVHCTPLCMTLGIL